MTIYIYWVHYPDHNDPLTEGYIGVSSDPTRRFRKHKRSSHNNKVKGAISKGAIQTILYEFDSYDNAYRVEESLRPLPNIGWNIAIGGLGGSFKDSGWCSERNRKRYLDPNERSKTAEANRKRFEDEHERKRFSELSKKFWSDPEYVRKQKQPRVKNMCPVMCEGIRYESVGDAEKAYPGSYIRRRFDSERWPEFYRLKEKVRKK